MLDERELFKKEKPFKIGEYLLPGILDVAAQTEFLRTTMSNQDLIFYANLPDAFYDIQIPDDFLDRLNLAQIKLRTLLTLLETADATTLQGSIDIAETTYRNIYPDDYEGLEILPIEGKILLSIYNGEEIAFQVLLENAGTQWVIEKYMTHFKLYGYNIEIRDNLEGNEFILLHPPIENLGVFPQVRDYASIANIKIPAHDDDYWFIQLFDVIEIKDDFGKIFYYDYFTIAPYRGRCIKVYDESELTAQLIVTEIEGGVKLEHKSKETFKMPIGDQEIQTTYTATQNSTINSGAVEFVDFIEEHGRLTERISTIKKEGLKMPCSTKVEYFADEPVKSFELRFDDNMDITTVVVDDQVYIRGEFSAFLSPGGYYVFYIEKTGQLIPVSFTQDFVVKILQTKVKPVFLVADGNAHLPLSNVAGLAKVISLN